MRTTRVAKRLAALIGTATLSLAVAVMGLGGGSTTASARPHAADLSNGCSSAITNTASPDTVRICEPATVTLDTFPTCPACPGGIRVAFVQRGEVTDAAWQRQQEMDALEELEKQFGSRLQATVIQYEKGSARAIVPLTDKLTSVRGAINRPRPVSNPPDANGDADKAASLAVKQLQPPRGEKETMPACTLVLFFAQDSPTPA